MIKRLFVLLLVSSLACSFITQVTPTAAPPTAEAATAEAATAEATPVDPEPSPRATRLPTDTPRPGPTDAATAEPEPTRDAVATRDDETRADQLELFDDVWELVRENYVYPDYNGADWEGLYDTYYEHVAAAETSDDFYAVMSALIEELGDEHSAFLSPEEAREQIESTQGTLDYVGIGILRDMLPEKRAAVILLVFPGSPAERAGLQAHDTILAVNGTPVIDDEGNSHMEQIRGPEGTPVTLTVRSVGEEPRDVTIIRERVVAQYPVITRRLAGDIGYILIPTFDDQTMAPRVKDALDELAADGAPLKGLIIDLRLNPGGTETTLRGMLSLFTSGTVGYFSRQGEREPLEIDADDHAGSQELPLVIMVGHGTQSFAEVFSGVLQDLERATLVGTTTTGNVEIIWAYEYPDGSRLWLASETFMPLHSQARWEETGIVPDVLVEGSWDEFDDESDPQIQAALEVFNR